MKTLFKSIIALAIVATAFASCVKEENAPVVNNSETKTVQFFANPIETKTAFGNPNGKVYPTLWTESDKNVKLFLNLNEEYTPKVSVSNDFKTATFNAEITLNDENPSKAPYVFYAMSPESAYLGKSSGRYSATIPSTQTPLEHSVDESAQILYAVSEEFDEIPSSVSLNFKHFTAYGKISFTNLELGDAKVTSVAISSPDVKLAGRWNYEIVDGSFTVNSGEDEITLTTNKTENLWFACAPVGSMDGKKLTFTVNTDKGAISKAVQISGSYSFTAGKIAKMTIDMSGLSFTESKVYDLVTDVNDLTIGSKVIIVANKSAFALSTTQNNNNRAQAAVTKTDNQIMNPGGGVQVITIENGKIDGTLAFNVGNGYLYAASSSSNYLRTETTLSNNSSWSVSISDGIATVKSVGTNTRNWLRHNSNNQMFSCYASGQNDIVIYKLRESESVKENYLEVSANSIEVTSDATSASFTVNSDLEWVPESDDPINISTEDNTVTVTFDINETPEEKTYTVTVVADGGLTQTIIITQAAKSDSNFEAGVYWIMGTKENATKVMQPLAADNNYGYASSEAAVDGKSYAKNVFTFAAVNGGYTIADVNGRYYYQEKGTTYKTFNAGTDGTLAGCVWTVTKNNDGTYTIVNKESGKTIRYAEGTYTSFGVYADSEANGSVLVNLVKADNPIASELSSISVSGHKTSFNEDEDFEFNGTVTATYTDGSTKNVTDKVQVLAPDMVDGAQVVVSYTEGEITKTFDYTISVIKEGEAVESITVEMDIKASKGTLSSDKNSISWTKDGFTCTNVKGSTAIRTSDSDHYRVYQNSTLKFTASNKTFNTVIVTCVNSSYATVLMNSAKAAKYTASASGSVVTITTTATSEISIKASAQTRITKVEVELN